MIVVPSMILLDRKQRFFGSELVARMCVGTFPFRAYPDIDGTNIFIEFDTVKFMATKRALSLLALDLVAAPVSTDRNIREAFLAAIPEISTRLQLHSVQHK